MLYREPISRYNIDSVFSDYPRTTIMLKGFCTPKFSSISIGSVRKNRSGNKGIQVPWTNTWKNDVKKMTRKPSVNRSSK